MFFWNSLAFSKYLYSKRKLRFGHIKKYQECLYTEEKKMCGKSKRVVVFPSLSRVRLFVTPRTAAHQVSLFFTISQILLKLMSTVIPSNHLLLCCEGGHLQAEDSNPGLGLLSYRNKLLLFMSPSP